jgi:mono/diheme cytochrome c family protein
MKRVLATLAVLALLGAATAAAVIHGGLYDISATDQHLAPTYKVLDVAMRRSVQQRADKIAVPALDAAATLERGRVLYGVHCEQCHGGPGVAPEPFALGLTPSAANLAHTARVWTPAEIYWVVKNGLKMTGMPAWEFRMADADLWAIVAFIRTLPTLSPQQYREWRTASPLARADEAPGAPPDAQRGKTAILQYACATCHHIPGVVGADAPVGPPLEGMASRALIAGVLPNTPANMVRWLRFPQAASPLGAMPDLGVTERDAHDMAAYLASLR